MPKVLVVDDEPDFIEFLRPSLEGMGLEVLMAESGEDAIDVYKKENPDLLVTDIVMPQMNGIELISELTKDNQDLPVITISGYPDWDDQLRAIAEMINVSLLKPIRIDDVVACVDICLNSSKPAKKQK